LGKGAAGSDGAASTAIAPRAAAAAAGAGGGTTAGAEVHQNLPAADTKAGGDAPEFEISAAPQEWNPDADSQPGEKK
jgi:hypothetical protein